LQAPLKQLPRAGFMLDDIFFSYAGEYATARAASAAGTIMVLFFYVYIHIVVLHLIDHHLFRTNCFAKRNLQLLVRKIPSL